jgi:sulfite exporter TauE/SafE
VQLLLGTIPLLLIAGTIEAFFSPTKAPIVLKFSLAAILFTALLLYLFAAGTRPAKAVRDL